MIILDEYIIRLLKINNFMHKKTTVKIYVILCIFVLAVLLCTILSYSLHPIVVGSASKESPRTSPGRSFIMTIELFPTINAPIQFRDIKISDTTEEKEIVAEGYVHNYKTSFWETAAGFFSDEDFKKLSEGDGLIPVGNVMENSGNCYLCVIFPKLPPRDHPIEIVVSYRIIGIIPKTDRIIYYWE